MRGEGIKKSERHFRLLVETTRYTLTILDPVTLLHRYVSPSIINIFGHTPEEFMQIPFYQMVDPSQSELVKKISASRLADFQLHPKDNKFHIDEFQLIAKDGSRSGLNLRTGLSQMKILASRKLSKLQGIVRKKKLWKCEGRKFHFFT
jgi:PAS domain-containing protein